MSSNLDVGPFSGGNIAVYQDVQSSGVAGTSVTTTIADQPINTEVIGKSWSSLSANQITLDAGKYLISVIDFGSLPNSTTKQYSFITNAANTVLDSTLWEVGNDQFPNQSYFRWTATVNLGSSTALKYRAKIDSGSATRLAHSQGAENYQKLIIQKIG